ncbi:hypothetical protein GGS20DRAFT_389706 [Poronia punctata]|nr:hypothetical protein GGS20DRAFT_389706 [Poronia punctata]
MAWWFIVFVTFGCGATTVALIPFQCLTGDGPQQIALHCNRPAQLRAESRQNLTTAIVDVVSDGAILVLPMFLVWKVRLPTKSKVILMIPFPATLLTIALTITRGAFFTDVYQNSGTKVTNTV